MIDKTFWRVAAVAALIAALAAAIFWPIHPLGWGHPGDPHDAAWVAAVTSPAYSLAYDLLILMVVACAVALSALTPVLAPMLTPRAGRWLVWLLPLWLLGFVLLASAGVFNAHVAPALAADAATQAFLDLHGPLLGGPLHGVFAIGGLLFAVANIVLAAVMARAKLFELPFAAALAIGAVGIGLHPMLGPVLRSIGFGLFALSYLRLAVACWRRAGIGP
jgi:hypothetical protein